MRISKQRSRSQRSTNRNGDIAISEKLPARKLLSAPHSLATHFGAKTSKSLVAWRLQIGLRDIVLAFPSGYGDAVFVGELPSLGGGVVGHGDSGVVDYFVVVPAEQG